MKTLSCVSTSELNSELHMCGSDPKPHSEGFENCSGRGLKKF